MGRIIGIDLGTTNSLVAVWETEKCKLIPNVFGEYLTPSVVSVDPDGTIYVGKTAKERLVSAPAKTAGSFKRYMGTSKQYQLGDRSFLPEELSAMVLRKLKEDAERYLKEEVKEAVISVPAYFNDMGRSAVKRAGKLAGLKVERIINEPSAAALAYRQLNMQDDTLVMVFDFGGGTLDVSLVECFDQVVEILAVSGDNCLGGKDFDEAMSAFFIKQCGLQDKKLTEGTKEVIKLSAEVCKKELTTSQEAVMTVKCSQINQSLQITRKDLVDICQEIFKRILVPVKHVLMDADIEAKQLDKIVLVGGSCKMSVVKQYLQHVLGREDIDAINPDFMIALGVGTYAGIKERNIEIKDILLTDICPFSLGIDVRNVRNEDMPLMSFVIQRNSALPVSIEEQFSNAFDFQEGAIINIYQGESMYAKDNILLGSMYIEFPLRRQGEVEIDVRFTYDINGVLEVNTLIPLTGEKHRLVIVNKELNLTEEEVEKKLEEFEQLKMLPADEEENQFVLSWAKRLFTLCSGELQQQLLSRILYFEDLIKQSDVYQIKKIRKYLTVFLAYVESLIQNTLGFDEEEFLKMEWLKDEDEKINQDEKEDFKKWDDDMRK